MACSKPSNNSTVWGAEVLRRNPRGLLSRSTTTKTTHQLNLPERSCWLLSDPLQENRLPSPWLWRFLYDRQAGGGLDHLPAGMRREDAPWVFREGTVERTPWADDSRGECDELPITKGSPLASHAAAAEKNCHAMAVVFEPRCGGETCDDIALPLRPLTCPSSERLELAEDSKVGEERKVMPLANWVAAFVYEAKKQPQRQRSATAEMDLHKRRKGHTPATV